MNRGSSRHPHSSVLWLGEVLVGEQAAISAALEGPWLHPLQCETSDAPPLLHLHSPAGNSCLPLRP